MQASFFLRRSADEQQVAPEPGRTDGQRAGRLTEAALRLECASAARADPRVSGLDAEGDVS